MRPGRFPQLGVLVEDGQVFAWKFRKGAHLGPLAGARAELADPTQHRRVAAAAAVPLLLLTKKTKVQVFVVFANGQVRQHDVEGNTMMRLAQSEVVRFNALVASATP